MVPANAQFILWCKLYDSNHNYLGQIIPSPSLAQEQSDAIVRGAIVMGALTIAGTVATFTFTFDSSRVSQYILSREYVYTWVRTWPSDGATDEGPPSQPSDPVSVDPSEYVSLSGMATTPPSGCGITHLRIYRTVSGTAGTAFTYVDQIAVGQNTYSDVFSDNDIANKGTLQTAPYDVPPADLVGVKYHPSGFLVGFSKNIVYFSAPYQPHAWPDYSIQCDYPVVGIGIVGQTIVVVTKGNPVLMTGNSPLTMSVTKVNNAQSGTAKRAVVETGAAVIYATPIGLVESPSGQVISLNLYNKRQWQALDPSSMQLVWNDNKLFLFTTSGLKMLRMDSALSELTETPDVITSHFVDLLSDTLYLSINGQIVPWASGAPRTYTYQTRTYVLPTPVMPCAYRLSTEGNTGTVVLSLYADGSLCYSAPITSGDAHWLPALPRAKQWSMQVTGSCTIRELLVSDSIWSL